MYSLIRSLTVKELLATEAPGLAVSLVIAELFYKFHSFALECAAFLATWWACGVVTRAIARPASRP